MGPSAGLFTTSVKDGDQGVADLRLSHLATVPCVIILI